MSNPSQSPEVEELLNLLNQKGCGVFDNM